VKLTVGLGNPGAKYAKTRHNVGFMAIDKLAKDLKLSFKLNRSLKTELAQNDEFILMKPQTFMNNSGVTVRAIIKKFNINLSDVLIIFDDLDMEIGKIRYRDTGSSGGHRGMQSIIDHLKTNNIKRLKIGIGRSQRISPDQYVTDNFTKEQLQQTKTALSVAIDEINNKFINKT